MLLATHHSPLATTFSPLVPRRGMILLIVMVMLALFAIVAISFVFYAESEATAMRYARAAESQAQADVDPELLLNYFLGQLIYDTQNVNSSMRGHSLARNMYGYNYDPVAANPLILNTNPYSGIGKQNYSVVGPGAFAGGKPNNLLVNYQYYPGHNFRRDPERYMLSPTPSDPKSLGSYTGEGGVSWTYPDLDNMFLAAVNADGEVLQASFSRPWTGFDPLVTTDPWQPYLGLRPHKIYNDGKGDPTKAFADPEPGGDVKNLDFSRGTVGYDGSGNRIYVNNDSYWMDCGFPVMTAPNGKKYKPLFAPLIIDLDGKVNLNAHGNVKGNSGVHVSNQGWGPWAVNLSKVLNQSDYSQLFRVTTPLPTPRYGTANGGQPDGVVCPPIGKLYSMTDFDGIKSTGAPSDRALYPGEAANTTPSFFGFPTYNLSGAGSYGNGSVANEGITHPSAFSVLYPGGGVPGGDDRVFGWPHMEAILRWGGKGSPALTSDLFRLAPVNFADSSSPANALEAARRRRMVTAHSWDLNRPGATPWLPSSAATGYQIATGDFYPKMSPLPPTTPPALPTSPGTGEYGADWRGAAPGLGITKINLNRSLPDYPTVPIDPSNGASPDTIAFFNAQAARQKLAQDIFDRLRLVTTGARSTDPLPPVTATPDNQYLALRWLAQLAVNMVDYIDNDDISTPFMWNPDSSSMAPAPEYVFGTELPKVVINEVYAEVVNSALDMGPMAATHNYTVNFWAELLNPLPADGTGQSDATLEVTGPGTVGTYPAYKLTIANPNANPALMFAELNQGTPTPTDVILDVSKYDYDAMASVQPAGGTVAALKSVKPAGASYAGPAGPDAGNQGFYVMGPKDNFPGNGPNPTMRIQDQTIGGVRSSMSYSQLNPADNTTGGIPNTTDLAANRPKYNLFLRRLACPQLPPDVNPASKSYNPYITIDYVQNVTVSDGVNYTGNVVTPMNADLQPVPNRTSVGRMQPYASDKSGPNPQWLAQSPDIDPMTAGIQPYMDQPQHTFFQHNGVDVITPPTPLTTPNTLAVPFDWLVHMDRPLVSPAELLLVSAYKPYELTQRFAYQSAAANHGHLAPWQDQNSLIYRLLEFVECRAEPTLFSDPSVTASAGSPATFSCAPKGANGKLFNLPSGIPVAFQIDTGPGAEFVRGVTGPGNTITATLASPHTSTQLVGSLAIGATAEGRVPGKININTVFQKSPAKTDGTPDTDPRGDQPIFEALCDRQATVSLFQDADVQSMFMNLNKSRKYLAPTSPLVDIRPGMNDKPFKSFASGIVTGSNGLPDTFLRFSDPIANTGPRLFDIAPSGVPANVANHPYAKIELLNKILNNVTTRSNVFAVWVTVGFFEVDDTANPPKIGREIGKAENRNVRHRMFTIVDRSELALFRSTMQSAVTPNVSAVAVSFPTLTKPDGSTFTFPVTSPAQTFLLEVDSGGNPETVLATVMGSNSVSAIFALPHVAGCSVTCRGNPGPWVAYDPRRDTAVVPYFSIIE